MDIPGKFLETSYPLKQLYLPIYFSPLLKYVELGLPSTDIALLGVAE